MLTYLKNVILLISIVTLTVVAWAEEDPKALEDALQIDQKLSQQLDLDLTFTNDSGSQIQLKELFVPGRPVIITPVYYHCPRLCGLLLDGALELFKKLELDIGSEYQVITVSFDPTDTYKLARDKSDKFFGELASSHQLKERKGWDFLVGDERNVHTLMEQLGFKYLKDKDDFAHSAILVLITPEGKISRYFFGIDFPAWDVRLSLIEASQGGIGSLLDHALLLCFRFDPIKGKYAWVAFGLTKIVGTLTLFCLVLLVVYLSRKYGSKKVEVV